MSATETTDVYYIFLMTPKRERRGHQMQLEGSRSKRSWCFKEQEKSVLLPAKGHHGCKNVPRVHERTRQTSPEQIH